MAMEYSILPTTVPISSATDKLDGTNNSIYATLASLQAIAETMGDGWTAQNITSTSSLTIQFRRNSSTTANLAVGKNLPVLKHSRYPKLAFAIVSGNASQFQNINAQIINTQTGALLTWSTITNINNVITSFDVYSFNAKTKAICGVMDLNMQSPSVLMFAENGAILTHQAHDAGNTNSLGVALADGTYNYTDYANTWIANPMFTFEPVFSKSNPSLAFAGLYVLTRGQDMMARTVTKDGITYKIFGNNTNWQNMNRPKLVVASTILG